MGFKPLVTGPRAKTRKTAFFSLEDENRFSSHFIRLLLKKWPPHYRQNEWTKLRVYIRHRLSLRLHDILKTLLKILQQFYLLHLKVIERNLDR